jgi:hypothetical protein
LAPASGRIRNTRRFANALLGWLRSAGSRPGRAEGWAAAICPVRLRRPTHRMPIPIGKASPCNTIYLPRDASTTHIGTIFHEKLPAGEVAKRTQMKFAPNTGYAFAVGDDTRHSADRVGPEVKMRDSVLLTYFVDAGALRFLRNRGKRFGNFLLSEVCDRVAH